MNFRYNPRRQVRIRFDFNADPPKADFDYCGMFHGARVLTTGFLLALLSIFLALPALPQTKFGVVASTGGGGGSGTVESVAATVPAFMAVSGSPITTTGTLGFSFVSQNANLIFGSPNGVAGVPIFRSLVAADIPALDPSKINGTAVITSDSRLSDARTPLAHASTHANVGSDAITIAPGQVTGTAVVTADARLSDARTPTAHASTHNAAGSDPVTVALGADTSGGYAGSASEAGPATTALALDANPADCAAGEFATAIAASGNLTCAEPSAADVTGLAASATTDTTNASNIASGTLNSARLPATIVADTTGKSATTDAINSATTVVNVSSATAPTIGQVLTATGGTAATWQTPSGASPGGSDTQVQYNDGGAFGGDAQFTFNETSGSTTITAASNDGSAAFRVLPGSGTSSTQINNNGSVVINGDSGTASTPLNVQSGGSSRLSVGAGGIITIGGGSASLAIGTKAGVTTGGRFETQGGWGVQVTAVKTTTYTTTATDGIVRLDPSGAGFTVTLSSANAAAVAVSGAHQVLILKNVTSSTNTITLSPSTGTIDGAASVTMTTAYGAARVFYDGTNWFTW